MAISTTKMEKGGRESFEVKENEFCFGNIDSQLEMKSRNSETCRVELDVLESSWPFRTRDMRLSFFFVSFTEPTIFVRRREGKVESRKITSMNSNDLLLYHKLPKIYWLKIMIYYFSQF